MKKYIPVIIGIVMMACGGGAASYAYWEATIQANVYEFITKSGRVCVFVTDGNAGGLSCE